MSARSAHRNVRFTTIVLTAALAVGASLGFAQSASAAGVYVYNSQPATLPSSYPSLGFNGSGTDELGQHIHLGGTDRVLEDVSVGFTSWACEIGEWTAGCVTTPGTSFVHPITINVYAVGADPTVAGNATGALLATVTQPITVPFRPTSDATCADSRNYVDAAGVCQTGLAFLANFSLGSLGVTLPDDIIMSVAFNTSTTGATPIGIAGKYDALNLSIAPVTPSVGSDPDTGNMFNSSPRASRYADGGASGVGYLRVDTTWTGQRLVLAVTASPAPSAPAAATPAAPQLAATGSNILEQPLSWIALGGILLGTAAVIGATAYRRRSVGS